MTAQDWIVEFWQVGNWIVGFEMIQSITLLYALTKPEVRQSTENPLLRRYIATGMIVLAVAFCVATFWTSAQAIDLHNTLAKAEGASPLPAAKTLWIMVVGRIGCIVLLTVLCVLALFVHSMGRESNRASQGDTAAR